MRPGPKNPDHELVIQAMPAALRLARTLARLYRVQTREGIEDCEQTACQALLEARPGYDAARAPFNVYAWKRVAGAVTKLVRRELSLRRTGLDEALDASEELRDTSDPFNDEDEDALARLKSQCRWMVFTRFMGDTRAALEAKPEDALVRARAFEALSSALGGLEEEEKRLLALRYWEGLTWEQVAEAMLVNERQAKRIEERLRGRLKRDLFRRGVEEAPPSPRA